VKSVMIALIIAYQRFVAPAMPPVCIYQPSCSSFALDAYRRHGFRRGTRLALGRLLRCWPWSAGGFDPVP
jgi:uncharacterized protein